MGISSITEVSVWTKSDGGYFEEVAGLIVRD